MKQIGCTENGTLIIECTPEEWAVWAVASRKEREAPSNVPQDLDKWATKFQADLYHFGLNYGLNVRAYNQLLRYLYGYHSRKVNEKSGDLFALNGRFLSFDEWILIVRSRRDELLRVRMIGEGLADHILETIGKYLQETTA